MKNKKQKNKEDKEQEDKIKKQETSQEKQAMIIIGIMLIIILIVVGTYYGIKASNKFTYMGMSVKKIKYGKILLYSMDVPLLDESKQNIVGYLNIDFRNDPRKLKDISVELIDDTKGIEIIGNKAYVGITEPILKCEDTMIALGNLGLFFSKTGMAVESGINNQTFANENNSTYISCNDASSEKTVIIFSSGDETSIKENIENCYEISFKDCEDVTKPTEKFVLSMFEHHMEKNNLI